MPPTTQSPNDPTHVPLYVLHTSLPIRWWLTDLSGATEAKRFMDEELAHGRITVVAVEGTEFQVLHELAKNLRGFQLDPSIATALFNDVSKVFGEMAEHGILRSVNRKVLAFSAFIVATLYDVSFCDALAVALAAQTECPLLVADEQLYQKMRFIQADRPAFTVIRLSDL